MPFEPNHLSILGIIHTALSILAIISAYIALFRYGKISPTNTAGKTYIVLTILTCVTSLPVMKLGHPTAGHYLAIIILALLPIGIYAKSIPLIKKASDYVQIIIMSTTLFLSMIPATVETLTRVPISNPIAKDPNDPIVQKGLMIFVIIYAIGTIYQMLKLRKEKKKSPIEPGATINFG
jgi:tryptophan-rich sensory protein